MVTTIDGTETLGAYGHAWTEFHDGTRWVHRDPTDIEGGTPLGYVRYGVLEEGPGYALSLFTKMNRSVTAVRVLDPARDEAPDTGE